MPSDTQISCPDGNADPGYGYSFFPSADYNSAYQIRRPSMGFNPALTAVISLSSDEINFEQEEEDELIPAATISCHVCFRR
uniref:Uncharacterized protein n=1 Tax=Panagrolaimus superbus TaxID=310955 RepID=A0A914XU78_9BILA